MELATQRYMGFVTHEKKRGSNPTYHTETHTYEKKIEIKNKFSLCGFHATCKKIFKKKT